MRHKRPLVLLLGFTIGLGLGGCEDSQKREQLMDFIQEVKSKKPGAIPPLPIFIGQPLYKYSAASLRSPFDLPIVELDPVNKDPKANGVPAPDKDRIRETLERFSVESLTMVGTIEQKRDLYALIDDGESGVHKVRPGNYMGRNNGKIVEISEDRIKLIEVVPDGQGGWVERPRTLALKTEE